MPGMVGERRPGEARQTDYITPFAINARATCFRYDGRVAPQQILRDGEVQRLFLLLPPLGIWCCPRGRGRARCFCMARTRAALWIWIRLVRTPG